MWRSVFCEGLKIPRWAKASFGRWEKPDWAVFRPKDEFNGAREVYFLACALRHISKYHGIQKNKPKVLPDRQDFLPKSENQLCRSL